MKRRSERESCRAPAYLVLLLALIGLAFYTLWPRPSFVSMVIYTTSPSTTTPSQDVEQGLHHTHKPPSLTIPSLSDVKQGLYQPDNSIPSSEVPHHTHNSPSHPLTSPLDVKQEESQTHKPPTSSLPNTKQGPHHTHKPLSHTKPSLSDVKQEPHKPANTDSSSLATLLAGLKFNNNYGIVKSSDQFVMQDIPCRYLESQYVSGPYLGWADLHKSPYLFRDVDGNLLSPPKGMRSAVPLGGISTGSFELRADGKFYEWTIFNQYPAGAAKIQVIDDVFLGVQTATANGSVAVVLQTHPNDTRLPAVESLQYQGAHPTSRLDVRDSRLPVDISIHAYPRYKFNDMNTSATPAVAFTATIRNPLNERVNASLLFNLPLGIEPNTQRMESQMASPIIPSNLSFSLGQYLATSHLDCFSFCSNLSSCLSWSYNSTNQACSIFEDVRLNGHKDGSYSGIKGTWSVVDNCITLNRDAPGSLANGNISLCVFSDQEVTPSFGTADDSVTLWQQFESEGQLPGATKGSYVTGATSASVSLGPMETAEITIVLGWFFPDRDFLGLPVGNFYSHLVSDSVNAANLLGKNLKSAVMDIQALHRPFFDSSLPDVMQDMLINSLSHIRSAFWLADGRWRQWEAYDCVNLDSVHNDGERHIPYITIFPNSTINKLYAWAKFQLPNGMIQEQLRCGCVHIPLEPQEVEFGCGRNMSDVSSMFIVYLLELQTWYQNTSITSAVLRDLWPHAKRAAEWQMNISSIDGIPHNLVNTYDYLHLRAYRHSTYSGTFHLLAMKAAEKLAYEIGDAKFAAKCHEAFLEGQAALDHFLWNETAQYYNAYTNMGFDYEKFVNATRLKLCGTSDEAASALDDSKGGAQEEEDPTGQECVEGDPATPGAIMTDSFYSQVLAYSLGLGTLVQDEKKLRLHMKAELDHNDSPYGLLVMTGRFPYPGPDTDNAVWMMGNPNWGTINLHLREDTEKALEVALKAYKRWSSVFHDEWNVPGVLGGIGYTVDGSRVDGQTYFTSHYGFYMSSWHLVMGLSGQLANVTKKSLTFAPRLDPPYSLPVILPAVWGYLQADIDNTSVSYTVGLEFGSLELSYLAVLGCQYPTSPTTLKPSGSVTWLCPM